MPTTSPHIKTVSTLAFRKNLGALTDEVLYGNVWLKVTKNKTKALLLKPWESGGDGKVGEKARQERAQQLMEDIRKIQKRNSKKTRLINGMSWSEFIQRDRHSH